MNKKHFIRIVATITILSLAWIILTPKLFPEAQADMVETAPHPGFFAPPFTLNTPQGVTHFIADYEGNPVLVFFWASWCSVCKSAMPGLEAVYQDFSPHGFTILAINTTSQDTRSTAEAYFQSQGYSYTMLLDLDGRVSNVYQMRAVPTSVLIGPDGKVTDVIIGSGITPGVLRARLNDLIAEGEE